MTWYERRELLLHMAIFEPGYGCVKLVHERHRGRVIMNPRGYNGWKPGFYPPTHPLYARMAAHYAAKHKAATMRLPK